MLATDANANKPDQEATETVNTINEQFIAEVNEATLEGTSPPKTKKIDIILRVAAALHIFNHVTEELLQGSPHSQQTKSKSLHFSAPSNT